MEKSSVTNVPWQPLTSDERRHVYATYGPSCFLYVAPSTEQEKMRNPTKYLKFPICSPCTGNVVPAAVLAARRRAFLTRGRVGYMYDDVVRKATEMIDKNRWTFRSLEDLPIASITVRCKPSFALLVTYRDGTRSLRDKISPRTALRTFGRFLTERQRAVVRRQMIEK